MSGWMSGATVRVRQSALQRSPEGLGSEKSSSVASADTRSCHPSGLTIARYTLLLRCRVVAAVRDYRAEDAASCPRLFLRSIGLPSEMRCQMIAVSGDGVTHSGIAYSARSSYLAKAPTESPELARAWSPSAGHSWWCMHSPGSRSMRDYAWFVRPRIAIDDATACPSADHQLEPRLSWELAAAIL